jgi:Zn-dependent peptidase ImmA (M78 family)
MKLQIGGKDYRIKSGEKEVLDYFGVYGFYDEYNQAIYISDDLSEDHYLETLLHEILHAVHREYAINLDKETEEQVILATSKGLRAIIKNHDRETIESILYGD